MHRDVRFDVDFPVLVDEVGGSLNKSLRSQIMFKQFMLSKYSRRIRQGLAIGIASLATSAALAAPPASAVGTWLLLVDQTYTTLDITNQGGPGAPGSTVCRVVLGTIGIAPVRGTYCPDSGHIEILHNNLATGATVRTFSGSLSAATATDPAHMAGTMQVMNAAFGSFGEYPFSGFRQ
jgi:hypothetical protein